MKTSTTSTAQTADSKSLSNIRFITITALFIALTYVFTAFINIRLPITANGGLIHLGNVPLFICAIIFGKKSGAIAGGVGMGLFDLLSGWTAWAPFTLIIVGLMGYAVGAITEKHHGFGWNTLAIAVACVIKVAGYYCRGYHLRKLDRTGYFHSWKPCPDRCCCCHRSFDRRTASENRK